jgi:calcineurin-like phosphoesterase family protein
VKITEELKNKIARHLDEKYQPEIKVLDNAYEAYTTEKTAELLQILTNVCHEHPFIKDLVTTESYRTYDLPSVIHSHLHSPTNPEYKAYIDAKTEIQTRRRHESEAITIKLSYLNDFAALQTALADLGCPL